MIRIATLLTALVAAGAFASQAEAHLFHPFNRFDDGPEFRDQGQPHKSHCEQRRRMEMEEQMLEQQRAEKREQMQAARAAAAAAAERRARFAAIQQQKAKAAAQAQAEAAAEATAQKRNSDAQQAQTPAVTNSAKKADLQPVSTATVTPAKSAAVAASEVCRRYSTAADAVVDLPCQ